MFTGELISCDKLRILMRVTYGYYVIERILQKSTNEHTKAAVRAEALKNFKHIGVNSLKSKWTELLGVPESERKNSNSEGSEHSHNSSERQY